MRLKIFIIAAVLAVLSPAASYCIGKPGAIVVFVAGDVRIKPAAEAEFREMKVNELLYVGDIIRTGPQSLASVILKSGAEVRLNESTVFGVYPKGAGREMSALKEGQIWTKMLHKMAKLDVSTPAAICCVRGTEADIRQKGRLTVKVYEGHVDVMNRFGKQPLSAGEMTSVSGPRSAPSAPRNIAASKAGKWHEAIEVKDMGAFLARILPDAGVEKRTVTLVGKDGIKRNVVIRLKRKS